MTRSFINSYSSYLSIDGGVPSYSIACFGFGGDIYNLSSCSPCSYCFWLLINSKSISSTFGDCGRSSSLSFKAEISPARLRLSLIISLTSYFTRHSSTSIKCFLNFSTLSYIIRHSSLVLTCHSSVIL
jgi:hypothetical protein